MNKIPIALQVANEGFGSKDCFDEETFDKLQFTGKRVRELMIQFGGICVEAALKAVNKEVQKSIKGKQIVYLSRQSILTTYPKENIK